MNKRLRYNLITFVIYFIVFYVMLFPIALFDIRYLLVNVSYSLILGFITGILNSIYIELRRLNGEKFEQFDEKKEKEEVKKDELIKS